MKKNAMVALIDQNKESECTANHIRCNNSMTQIFMSKYFFSWTSEHVYTCASRALSKTWGSKRAGCPTLTNFTLIKDKDAEKEKSNLGTRYFMKKWRQKIRQKPLQAHCQRWAIIKEIIFHFFGYRGSVNTREPILNQSNAIMYQSLWT